MLDMLDMLDMHDSKIIMLGLLRVPRAVNISSACLLLQQRSGELKPAQSFGSSPLDVLH